MVVVTALLLVVGLVGVALHDRAGHSVASRRPPTPTTSTPQLLPPTGPGTKVLREPVDPLAIAVPYLWQSVTLDPAVVAGNLEALALKHPLLVVPLQAASKAAQEGAIRLFAVTADPALTYVEVVSFASPGAAPIPDSQLSTLTAKMKRSTGITGDATRIDLPAGPAVRIQVHLVKRGQAVAVEDDIFQHGDRTILILMAAEGATDGIPPVFSQIASSVRIG